MEPRSTFRPRYEYPPSQSYQMNGPSGAGHQQQQQQHLQQQQQYQQPQQQYAGPNGSIQGQGGYHGQPGPGGGMGVGGQQGPGQGPGQQGGGVQGGGMGAGAGAGGAGSNIDAQSQANSGGAMQQEMNLAGVLHYLQSEWRRWERDRNEWEIERAEMRARIALLEGQRRSAENLKVDLLRRVKMLEYALRQERTKTVSTVGKLALPPSRLSTLQDEDKLSRDEKEGSGSSDGASEEGAQDRPKMNGIHPAAMSRANTMGSRTSDSPWKSIGTAVPKDPKARARSREYLKQCLQEITYLTSPGALNPLPPRAPITIDPPEPTSPTSGTGQLPPESAAHAELDRPKKSLPDEMPPSMFAAGPRDSEGVGGGAGTGPGEADKEKSPEPPREGEKGNGLRVPADQAAPAASLAGKGVEGAKDKPAAKEKQKSPALRPKSKVDSSTPSSAAASSSSLGVDNRSNMLPPSSPANRPISLPLDPPDSSSATSDPGAGSPEGRQLLTAIYRPDSKAAWREELRAANMAAERVRQRSPSSASASSTTSTASDSSSAAGSAASSALTRGTSPNPTDEEQLHALTLSVDDDSSAAAVGVREQDAPAEERTWTNRKVLRSHLDIVRTVAFAHGPGVMLASGGDDCLVKVWHLDAGAVMSPKPHTAELEPIATYRSHTAPVTCLTISTPLQTIFSGSLDSSIYAWHLPSPSHDPYAPHDPSTIYQLLEGHTDAIWDLCLLPSSSPARPASATTAAAGGSGLSSVRSNPPPHTKLVSASADGSVKVWSQSSTSNVVSAPIAAAVSGSGSGGRDPASVERWNLERTIEFDGAAPTCLGAYAQEGGKVLVGFRDGRVGLVDVEADDAEERMEWFGRAEEGDSKQVNAVLCHTTWPVIIAGYEDGYIRFWNARSCQTALIFTAATEASHSILAHPAPVSSLTLSPLSPSGLISAATDCSIRVWDLNKKTSIQDCAGHRQRGGEGVGGLASHPELPVFASAGADGVVRVWSSA